MYDKFLKQVLLDKNFCELNSIVNVINSIYIDRKISSNICDIIKQYGNHAFIVADINTAALLDKVVFSTFQNFIILHKYCASQELVDLIQKKSQDADILVSFGSGTVNDICKYVSYITNKSYISFPTAPSMNGYSSSNASITFNCGNKKSLKAHLPKAIYVDIDIIVNAPQRLIVSGFADFICRSTVQADWLLSHILLGNEYTELPFLISRASEEALLAEYLGLVKRDEHSIMVLMQALLLSGLGMFIVGGSESASQGEHMIANTIEILQNNMSFFHGEFIGVSSVIMECLQKRILKQVPILYPTLISSDSIKEYFQVQHAEEFCDILTEKFIDQQKADNLNSLICNKWSDIVDMIHEKTLSSILIRDMLVNVDCPCKPEHIGWDSRKYSKAAEFAFVTRRRFTFLDIAHHARLPVVEHI
ncbi:sn-glycerol-1-phosphate dehydrogenase [Ehrlichia ruminantium]|uniref:Sn-glycerol-1-phosphate dehydrogenase n=1 Tax=Ehrlichia ruminantium TaxID=779 RepID=A0AAE6QAR9_EHRRU|nr:iron-containing alcohol dehydrogenase [Ehrlichia ruminantium]QGR02901.1 sn-glycerol-1-phosphate dehydrogenase [Ehrlichia ruminantium]QGR03825.1 sn-glycerol-1-phosphate dehydrogenase [Ehrlichia ruminantium]QGR04752.1 sn-glycerol-1-phosphate dehydrogenase [Ehrlichia ruminantium]